MKVLRRISEILLIALVMVSMLYASSEWLGMRWVAAPFLRLAEAFK